MSDHTPTEIHNRWAQAFNEGDLEGLIQFYEPEAVLMPQPGQTVTGHAAIREALKGFLALGATFKPEFQMALEMGELALLYSNWVLVGTAPDGSEIHLTGQTSDVVRRQADGSWLFVIDNPYGGAGVGDSLPQ